MNIYVPASSEPPNLRWKQKLSVVVVLGAGLAIASVAISTFDRPGQVAPKAKLPPPLARLPGPSFTLAPAQVSDPALATPAPHDRERIEPPVPQVAPAVRTQLLFTQPVTRVEPTALPHERRYRPPPSSFMPPLSRAETTFETGVAAGPPPVVPSNMTVLGDGVYQVASGAPAVQQGPPETIGPSEPSTSDQAEANLTGPVNALRADDHGSLLDSSQTCGPDRPAKAQDLAQTGDASTTSDPNTNSAESPTVGPDVRVAPAAALPRPVELMESTAPEGVEDGQAKALPAQSSSRADTSGVSGATPPPPGATAVRGDEAASGSTSPGAADTSMPCEVSVQVGGKPTAGLPIFLVGSDEPAVRLSSLLDLVRHDLPSDEFQRLRRSASAEAILSIRDLVSAGFTFQVIGNELGMSVTG